MIYSAAISALVESMLELGIVLHLSYDGSAFWNTSSKVRRTTSDASLYRAADVEFVDDAALLACANSPSQLMKAIPELLRRLVTCFQKFGFHFELVGWQNGGIR